MTTAAARSARTHMRQKGGEGAAGGGEARTAGGGESVHPQYYVCGEALGGWADQAGPPPGVGRPLAANGRAEGDRSEEGRG